MSFHDTAPLPQLIKTMQQSQRSRGCSRRVWCNTWEANNCKGWKGGISAGKETGLEFQ